MNLRSRDRAQKSEVQPTVEKLKEEIKDTLLSFDLLDTWQKDNQYILTGYRRTSYSYWKSLKSIFSVHNETVNIWTHLVPGMIFSAILLAIVVQKQSQDEIFTSLQDHFAQRYESAGVNDARVILIFIAGATSMFSASWFYHTISNHSNSVSKYWNKLDYVGIICMIIGSFYPSVYYGHYCETTMIEFYLILLSSFGVLAFCFTILDRFRTPSWRPYRAGMFIALGLSAVFPVCEAILTHGLAKVEREMSLTFVVMQGALYIAGAVIYACRVPEKYYPKTFDNFGSSHQIFHVCVVIAGILHAIGVYRAFDYRHGELAGQCG